MRITIESDETPTAAHIGDQAVPAPYDTSGSNTGNSGLSAGECIDPLSPVARLELVTDTKADGATIAASAVPAGAAPKL